MRDVSLDDIFVAASEFCKWVQFGIDVYIPHRKYQVKSHSSPWFSAACVATIVHRNHFFRLYQREKSSDSKVKFRQASNRCKRVLEAAKLAYANKTKESITSQKLGSWDFWRIANSALNKGKSAIPPPFNGPEVLLCASDIGKLLTENFSKNSNLHVSLYLFSLLELIWNFIIFVSLTIWICQRCLVLIVFQWWFYRTVSLNFFTY